jgi:ribokinase
VVEVAVVGGINIDVLALVDRQPDDDHPSLILAVSDAIGGKGANQAVAAARLGASVRLLGAVGDDDDGRRVLTELSAAGIDCSAVRIVAAERTGRVVGTVTADGDVEATKRTSALGGANLRLTDADVDAFTPVLERADVVIVQLEPPPGVVRATLERAPGAGVATLLDNPPAQGPVRDLFPLARWVTGNHSEIEAASGMAVDDRASASTAAHVMRAAGPQLVGVTVGASGQLVSWADGEAWCEPSRAVKIVDTAGAGDAFAATLAVLLAEGMTERDAAARAGVASTLACRRLGAQAALPTREEVQRAWS